MTPSDILGSGSSLPTPDASLVVGFVVLVIACFGFNQISLQARHEHLGWAYSNLFLIKTCLITTAMAGLLYAQHRVEAEDYLRAAGVMGGVRHTPLKRYAASAGVLGATVALLSLSHYVDGLHANHECSPKSKARRFVRSALSKYAIDEDDGARNSSFFRMPTRPHGKQ